MEETELVFAKVAEYFGLLADPTRLRILSCLCGTELPVREVVERVEMTQANISRHLNILFRSGVVGRRRQGNSVFYRVIDPNFIDICRTVSISVASQEMVAAVGKAAGRESQGFSKTSRETN